ncbi:MAG: DUF952 domain-containing protein [Granulosicoccus sp.]
MLKEGIIYHIARSPDLQKRLSTDDYRCASLKDEGFIHCCDQHQLAGVVNRYYQGVDELDLLMIDVDKLSCALIHENTVGGSELFPHVYGPIDASAIIEIIPFGLQSTERLGLLD